MAGADDVAEAFEAELIRAVSACGVDAIHLSLKYEDYLQDYDLIVSEGPLPPACVMCIADVVGQSAILSFTDPANAAELYRIQSKRTREWLRAKALNMPDLPRFDPSAMTLEAFAKELETYCGIEPGTAIEVRDGRFATLIPAFRLEEGDVQRVGRLIEALSVALVDHEGFRFGIVGGT